MSTNEGRSAYRPDCPNSREGQRGPLPRGRRLGSSVLISEATGQSCCCAAIRYGFSPLWRSKPLASTRSENYYTVTGICAPVRSPHLLRDGSVQASRPSGSRANVGHRDWNGPGPARPGTLLLRTCILRSELPARLHENTRSAGLIGVPIWLLRTWRCPRSTPATASGVGETTVTSTPPGGWP